jgi:hypothetical protein
MLAPEVRVLRRRGLLRMRVLSADARREADTHFPTRPPPVLQPDLLCATGNEASDSVPTVVSRVLWTAPLCRHRLIRLSTSSQIPETQRSRVHHQTSTYQTSCVHIILCIVWHQTCAASARLSRALSRCVSILYSAILSSHFKYFGPIYLRALR